MAASILIPLLSAHADESALPAINPQPADRKLTGRRAHPPDTRTLISMAASST